LIFHREGRVLNEIFMAVIKLTVAGRQTQLGNGRNMDPNMLFSGKVIIPDPTRTAQGYLGCSGN
jgi:hypothetical protein